MRLRTKILAGLALLLALPAGCGIIALTSSDTIPGGENVANVTTNIRLFGPNDKIIIDAFDDPKVKGVACHVSRATTGGFWYLLGMSEDASDASVACRQYGPLTYDWNDLVASTGEKVFKQSASMWFKTVQVRRHVDKKRRMLFYTINSDTIFSGSDKNSISSVALDIQQQ